MNIKKHVIEMILTDLRARQSRAQKKLRNNKYQFKLLASEQKDLKLEIKALGELLSEISPVKAPSEKESGTQ